MPTSLLGAAAAAALAVSLAGIVYLALAAVCLASFGKRRLKSGGGHSVTVFKPLCGTEPGLYENLCSFCDQEYAPFQVIFGVADPSDPAIEVARRVRAHFAAQDISIVVGGDARAANPKVRNLLNMAGAAAGDLFVIADSDMRVDRAYLRSIVEPFADPAVGAITCLYGGVALPGISSALGATFVNEYFAPSVLVALRLGELSFGFGATIAVRRAVLSAIGGFAVLAPHLADDYQLGRLVHDRGWRVALSPYVVRNIVGEPTVSALWRHELRWARTIRAVRPLGYALSGVTFPLPFAVLYLLLARNLWLGALLIGGVVALRLALHYLAPFALRVDAPRAPWLIPARDALAFAVWGASFFGRGIRWRARDFVLEAGGALEVKERPEGDPSKRPV